MTPPVRLLVDQWQVCHIFSKIAESYTSILLLILVSFTSFMALSFVHMLDFIKSPNLLQAMPPPFD